MHRRESGDLAFDLENAALSDAYRSTQSGWYLQGVYQFRRAGARACATTRSIPATRRSGSSRRGALRPRTSRRCCRAIRARTTVMLDWNPSEFSRWRLQYAWDEARDDGDTDQQLSLQYLFGIGAHGAHKY